jgi:hypothetical protein
VYICFQLFQRFSQQNTWCDNDPSIEKSVEHAHIHRIRDIVPRKRTVAANTSSTTTNLCPPSVGESDNGHIPQVLPESSANPEEGKDKKTQDVFVRCNGDGHSHLLGLSTIQCCWEREFYRSQRLLFRLCSPRWIYLRPYILHQSQHGVH